MPNYSFECPDCHNKQAIWLMATKRNEPQLCSVCSAPTKRVLLEVGIYTDSMSEKSLARERLQAELDRVKSHLKESLQAEKEESLYMSLANDAQEED